MRTNAGIVAFNRGLISPKSLARVDLDRVKLSAEVMSNWIATSQGSMSIRPGTRWKGSSIRDTGAYWVEFVAATDDVALLELTATTMRVWLGTDAHNLSLLSRPLVDTTVSLTDTGWTNASTGGAFATAATDIIPTMTSSTTSGVTITASSENTSSGNFGGDEYHAADDNISTAWQDTGDGNNSLPSWLNLNFGTDTGVWPAVTSYSVRANHRADYAASNPQAWRLIASNFDTGTYATDTGKWALEDERSGQTAWAVSEKRTFGTDQGDTGTVTPRRHWRLFITTSNGVGQIVLGEFELFTAAAAQQVKLQGGARIFNATSIGARAKATKRVIISDTGTEHALAIQIGRGPVTLRVGSSNGDDDYISETDLATGYHNLAFTPQGNFWITLQSDAVVDRIVSSLRISDSGTVELTTPWGAGNIDDIRHDQSADVVYVDCEDVRTQMIERRGTGRSFSVVDYAPDDGPFLPARSSSAKLSVSHFFGNTTMNSDIPFFASDHVGALVRAFHDGQSGQWRLGALDAYTDPIAMIGISDTGTAGSDSERRITFAASGTWTGTITIERSIDGPDIGFKTLPASFTTATDTGTFTKTIDDPDDNLKVWYRAKITSYTSGVAVITATYGGGGVTGIARITSYSSNTAVGIEVLSRFSDTGPSDNWQQGYWSDHRGYPTAVALHGGRLFHAQGGSVFGSVSDDYQSFDESTVGDAGPVIRTLGSGPVDNIHALLSLLRLIIHTAGAELTLRSSSLDEPVTPTNSSAGTFSTQGTAPLRALKMDNRAVFVQRSKQRLFMVGPDTQTAVGDYGSSELTLLVPDLLDAGIVSIAIQRQPDTRIWCVLSDGTAGVLTYEPAEEVVCWTTFSTPGASGAVERVAVLPGISEDAVYLHVRRTINGTTKRFLEKLAKESECQGDTGLHYLADCSSAFTDTGRATFLHAIAPHLPNTSLVVWGSLDSGSTPHVDMSPDTGSDFSQRLWTTDTGGDITLTGLTEGLHHAVAGLPYQADWRSSKLAYGAQAGTALGQSKRVAQTALILYNTHARGLYTGDDTGALDPLPRVIEGEVVDQDKIFPTLDMIANPTPGTHKTDPRTHIRAKAPRPATVLAAVPSVNTSERV